MKQKNNKSIGLSLTVLALFVLFLTPGCKKFVETPAPVNSQNAINVYESDISAAAVLTGIYTKMSKHSADFEWYNPTFEFSNLSLSVLPGLSADELNLYAAGNALYAPYYNNILTNISSTPANSFWEKTYPVVLACNAAIEGLEKSTKLTPAVKQQLLGEAKFMRAFCYFYLVNLYGDVPLAISTDYKVNYQLSRSPKAAVYQQIITDLAEAKSSLNASYVEADVMTTKTTTARVRPTKWAATALLARAYLYSEDYPKAETEATVVISQNAMYGLVLLNNVFLMNSKEAIWQLQPVGNYMYGENKANTAEGRIFILGADGPATDNSNHLLYLSAKQVNSFEPGDPRKSSWTGNVTVGASTYYYPFKYKIGEVSGAPTSEYMMVLRLAEQYLIRAEARAKQNNVAGAVSDLNTLRTRANGLTGILPALSASLSQQQALDAVAHERQVELFTEWGHRWLDLKRTGKIDAEMAASSVEKGSIWNSNKQLYPIPLSEMLRAPKLVQNPGYE